MFSLVPLFFKKLNVPYKMKLKTKKKGVSITFINGKAVMVEDIVEQTLQESLLKQCVKDFKLKLYLIGILLEAAFSFFCYPNPVSMIAPLIWCGYFLNSFITRYCQIKNENQ